MTYPVSFRKKVLDIKEQEGLSYGEVSRRFSLSKNTVFRWSKRLEPRMTRHRKATKIDMDALRRDIEKRWPPKIGQRCSVFKI